MKTWAFIAIAAVFALGFVSALAITDHTEQQAVIRTQAATSAATTITIFLLVLILVLILAVVGAVVGWRWLQGYQERQKMQKMLQQAQIYALLSGARPRAGRIPRPAMPAQAGGNILVFPGGGQQPVPQLTLDDLRAMLGGQSDPLSGLLPPDDGGGWQW